MPCERLQPGCVSNNVLIGHNGQLFLFEGHYNQFAFLTGAASVQPESQANFLSNLRQRRGWAERLGIPYLHVVVPCKPLVLRHQLPQPYKRSIRSLFLNAYAPLLRQRDPIQEQVLYPLDALIAAECRGSSYWADDTHINAAGQLALYKAIGQHLSDLSSNFPQFRLSQQPRLGDLGAMLGRDTPTTGLCFPWIGEAWPYANSDALPGNTGDLVMLHNPLSRTTRRLVLFGDSFIKTLLHLFAQDFRDVLYVRGPYFQPDLVELYKPDVLITSETERYLAGVDSDANGCSMLLRSVIPRPDYQPSDAFTEALAAQLAFRSHPRITQRWAEAQAQSHSLLFHEVGAAIHNRELRQIEGEGCRLEATGAVPVIHIHQLTRPPQGQLLIEFNSDQASQLTLTVLRHCPDMRAPLEVVEHPVQPGFNRILLEINHAIPFNGLLLQPLHQPGQLQLHRLSWTTDANG